VSEVELAPTGARASVIERLAHHEPSGSTFTDASLEQQFKIATAISNAVEAVPRGYRKQPGAVLLALAWAQAHELDILTTIQNVSFIEGKAVVDATMQRALAKRAGYELAIETTQDSASVTISQHGQRIGSAGFTMEEATDAELTEKKNWRHHREDMLVARATARVIRRYAPEVLLGMMSSDELDDDAPQLVDDESEAGGTERREVQAAGAQSSPEPPPTGPGSVSSTPSSLWASATEMRADMKARGIGTPAAVREAHRLAEDRGIEPPAGTLDAIYRYSESHPSYVEAFAAWVRNHDVTEP
jgi:hypothetical protein